MNFGKGTKMREGEITNRWLAILILLWGLSYGNCAGKIVYVGADMSDRDGGSFSYSDVVIIYPTIQAAIDACNDGDTVIIPPGTYKGDGNRDIDFLGKAITVRSTDPNDPNIIAATIIDCNGTEDNPHRGFYFHDEEDANSVLSGLTVTSGYVYMDDGAGIYCDLASPTISNCVISGNIAEGHCTFVGYCYGFGGGVCFLNSNSVITNCTIIGNIAAFGGGGINCFYGSPIIKNCVIVDNQGGRGCGVYCEGCSISIDGCVIRDNKGYAGGGVCCDWEGLANVTNCIITKNCTDNAGAGISVMGGSVILTNCMVTENRSIYDHGGGIMCWANGHLLANYSNISWNTAGYNAGGIWCIGSLTLRNSKIIGNSTDINGGGIGFQTDATVSNCTISGNVAIGKGGGVYFSASYSTPTFSDCTVTDNKANGGDGGGIYCGFDSNATLNNCILWNNIGNRGDEMYLSSASKWHPPTTSVLNYSSILGGMSAIYLESKCDLVWGNGNIDVDPCFTEPGYWDPNGTPGEPNDDFWIDGDYHLKSQAGRWEPATQAWIMDDVTSPCIDAGDPMSPIGLEPFPNGGIINMGAHGGTNEASKSYFGEPVCETIVAGDINGDCVVDFKDFQLMALHWLEDRSQP